MLLLWHNFYANVCSKPRNLEFTYLIFPNVTLIHSLNSSDYYLIPTIMLPCFCLFLSYGVIFYFSWTMHHKQTWKWKKEHAATRLTYQLKVAIQRVTVPPCSSLNAPRMVQTFKCGEVVRPIGDFVWQISNPNTFAFHFFRSFRIFVSFSYFCIYIHNKLSQNNEIFREN